MGLDPVTMAIGSAVIGGGGEALGAIGKEDAIINASRSRLEGIRDSQAAREEGIRNQRGQLRETRGELEDIFNKSTGDARGDLSRRYDQARDVLSPAIESQTNALAKLDDYTDVNSDFYKGEREAQSQAIMRQLSSQGLLRSKKQSDLLTNLELGLGRQRLGVLDNLSQGRTGAMGQAANLTANQGAREANLSTGLGSSLAGVAGGFGSGMNALTNREWESYADMISEGANIEASKSLALGDVWTDAFSGMMGSLGQGGGMAAKFGQQNQMMGQLGDIFGGGGGGGAVSGMSGGGFSGANLGVNTDILSGLGGMGGLPGI